MNFNSFLNEKIDVKQLDKELARFKKIEAEFNKSDLAGFVKNVVKETNDSQLEKEYKAAQEAIADFIYALDSSGGNL